MILPYTVVGVSGAMFCSRYLNLLNLGDEAAKGLGVPVERVRFALIVLAALLAASAVSVAGLLGFVGLVPQDNNMERELTVEEALTIYGRLFAVPCLTRYCTHWSICFLLGWEWAGDRGWAMSISVAFFIWGVALIRNYSE